MTESNPTKILFVDDEPDVELLMRQKFRRDLKSNKYDFYFALNGVEALKILEANKDIWLVISDINMPTMDGLTLLKEINQHHPTVITMIVSAYGDMSNIRKAMNLGAFDFVTKPINFEDFNTTIEKTLNHINQLLKSHETSERLENILVELNIASDIQQAILPKDFINDANINLHADMRAAKHIGGDFYDFFYLDKSKNLLGLVIADVSGKGIPAAMFMTVTRTLIRAKAPEHINSPGSCLTEVNKILEADNPNMMFVTVFYAILDITTGKLTYCNAGHNPPVIIHQDGTQTILDEAHGMAIAVSELQYQENTFQLIPEDMLFMYTDGVTEAENSQGAFFSDQRLFNFLAVQQNLAASDLVHRIEEEVNKFVAGYIQSDDITMLTCKYSGTKQS